MAEENKNRMELLKNLMELLKKIESDQQVTIEHIAKVQGEMQNEGKETIALKIGEVFSNATRNTQLLHEMISEFQMEFNKLKAESNSR